MGQKSSATSKHYLLHPGLRLHLEQNWIRGSDTPFRQLMSTSGILTKKEIQDAFLEMGVEGNLYAEGNKHLHHLHRTLWKAILLPPLQEFEFRKYNDVESELLEEFQIKHIDPINVQCISLDCPRVAQPGSNVQDIKIVMLNFVALFKGVGYQGGGMSHLAAFLLGIGFSRVQTYYLMFGLFVHPSFQLVRAYLQPKIGQQFDDKYRFPTSEEVKKVLNDMGEQQIVSQSEHLVALEWALTKAMFVNCYSYDVVMKLWSWLICYRCQFPSIIGLIMALFEANYKKYTSLPQTEKQKLQFFVFYANKPKTIDQKQLHDIIKVSTRRLETRSHIVEMMRKNWHYAQPLDIRLSAEDKAFILKAMGRQCD